MTEDQRKCANQLHNELARLQILKSDVDRAYFINEFDVLIDHVAKPLANKIHLDDSFITAREIKELYVKRLDERIADVQKEFEEL